MPKFRAGDIVRYDQDTRHLYTIVYIDEEYSTARVVQINDDYFYLRDVEFQVSLSLLIPAPFCIGDMVRYPGGVGGWSGWWEVIGLSVDFKSVRLRQASIAIWSADVEALIRHNKVTRFERILCEA